MKKLRRLMKMIYSLVCFYFSDNKILTNIENISLKSKYEIIIISGWDSSLKPINDVIIDMTKCEFKFDFDVLPLNIDDNIGYD